MLSGLVYDADDGTPIGRLDLRLRVPVGAVERRGGDQGRQRGCTGRSEGYRVDTASARSFLHNQVRSMVGSLKRVGEGGWTAADLKKALAARDNLETAHREAAGGVGNHLDWQRKVGHRDREERRRQQPAQVLGIADPDRAVTPDRHVELSARVDPEQPVVAGPVQEVEEAGRLGALALAGAQQRVVAVAMRVVERLVVLERQLDPQAALHALLRKVRDTRVAWAVLERGGSTKDVAAEQLPKPAIRLGSIASAAERIYIWEEIGPNDPW